MEFCCYVPVFALGCYLIVQLKKRHRESLIRQIVTNTSANRMHFVSQFLPLQIVQLVRQYDDIFQGIRLEISFPSVREDIMSVRPCGNFIIRLFSSTMEVFDWTQDTSTFHFTIDCNYAFSDFEVLNENEVLIKTKNGELFKYNFRTTKLELVFETDDLQFRYVRLPNHKVLILTNVANYLLHLQDSQQTQVFSLVRLEHSHMNFRLRPFIFRHCFETPYGYIFQVYQINPRRFYVFEWNIENNSWIAQCESSSEIRMEQDVTKTENLKSYLLSLDRATPWLRRLYGSHVLNMDPNSQENKPSHVLVEGFYSVLWFCNNGIIFKFGIDLDQCCIYA